VIYISTKTIKTPTSTNKMTTKSTRQRFRKM